jgi:hypothetical protein
VDGFGEVTMVQVKEWIASGQISKRTVAQLKCVCRELGVAVGGAKADLVDRIIAAAK